MNSSEKQTFPTKEPRLSVNGWIAAVILILLVFTIYYIYVFPQLVAQNQSMFYRQVNISDANSQLQIEASIPRNLSDIQEDNLTLNIACGSLDKPIKCTGTLDLVSFLVDENEKEINSSHVTLRRLDLKDQPAVARNLYIDYDLKSDEVMSVPVSVQISNSETKDTVAFSVYLNQSNESIVKWNDTTCKVDSTWICTSINPTEALRQSAIENLLLPPWSNGLLPMAIFAMVWLAEQVMPNKKEWSEQPNAWLIPLAGLSAYFLFLFYAVLRFYLLMEKPLLALLFAVLLVLFVITLPKLLSRGDK